MKTYMTIFVPELDIMHTISKDITKIDLDNPFKIYGESDNYYKVEPYLYSTGGYLVDTVSKTQLDDLDVYRSVIITDTERLKDILEDEMNILYHQLDNIGIIVTYTGDCNEYDGEQIAISKMIEYAVELKKMCLNRI